MADLEPSGYQTLRQCGATAWTRIAVQLDGANVFDPLPLTDPRVTQTISDTGILYTLVLRGSDPEINASPTNSVPVDGVALFPSGDTPVSVSKFLGFDFVDPQDVLTINHNIRLPGGAGMLSGRKVLNASRDMAADDFGSLIQGPGTGGGSPDLRVVGSVLQAAPIGSSFVLAATQTQVNLNRTAGDAVLRVSAPDGHLANVNLRLFPGSSVTLWKLTDENPPVLYGVGTTGVQQA